MPEAVFEPQPIQNVISDLPLKGKITHIDEKMLGQGRESEVYKGILKVGNRELPVIVKKPKQARLSDDVSLAQIEEVRRKLEQEKKFPMPYVYGKTETGLLIQEFIPGNKLDEEILDNPDFIDDSKRVELVEMALSIGSAVEEITNGEFTLRSLSPDDIIVAKSSTEITLRTEGKLVCVDPGIVPAYESYGSNKHLRDTPINIYSDIFKETLFANTNMFGEGSFTYKWSYKMGEAVREKTEYVDVITACFVQKREESEKDKSRWDLEVFDRSTAEKNFRALCSKVNILNEKLILFLFEMYYSKTLITYRKNDLVGIFNRKSIISDFKKYWIGLMKQG